jgi:hypothetical protein
MNQEQHQQLIDLSWRYAALIGITDISDIASPTDLEDDRRHYAHLVKLHNGRPSFDENDAVRFMMDKSGLSDADCRTVLLVEWAV